MYDFWHDHSPLEFSPPDPFDKYREDCEALGLDPYSPLTPYILEDLRWAFEPCDFLPDFDEEDIPF